jgi:hypothetical protein
LNVAAKPITDTDMWYETMNVWMTFHGSKLATASQLPFHCQTHFSFFLTTHSFPSFTLWLIAEDSDKVMGRRLLRTLGHVQQGHRVVSRSQEFIISDENHTSCHVRR